MIICEAADALFKWDDFALDLYFAERDEVFSLLNITTVEGQRVEIPSSPAAQDRQRPHPARHQKRRGTGVSRGSQTTIPPLHRDAGAHPQGRPGHRRAFHSKPHARRLHQPRFGNAPDSGRPMQRRAGTCPRRTGFARKPSSVSAICLKIRPMPFLSRTWMARCWM